MTAFLVGVVVGLVLPWVVVGLRDRWRHRRDDGPEELVRRAREAWGNGRKAS